MAEIIRDIITDIQSQYSKGVREVSSRLSNRMVYHHAKAIRAKLINEKSNKNQNFSDAFYQLLAGVEMIAVSSSMLPTLPVGSTMRGTKIPIPSFIYNMDNPIIASVSNVENSKVYNRTSWQTIKNNKGRKFTGKDPNYFTLENHLFINEMNRPKVIAIRAIFAEPIEAQLYPIYDDDCGVDSCTSYLDLSFAVDKDMANTIVAMTAEELIKIYGARQESRQENAVDNTK